MSRKVATLVYAKQAGSMARKAVLAYFADRANDDGTGIWAGKQRIADEIECSKQTVITTVKALAADGLIEETGRRPNSNGYTVEYRLNLDAIEALPNTKREAEGVQNWTGQDLDQSTSLTPRGQAALPEPSLNRPKPQKATPSSAARARPKSAYHRLPDDWQPPSALGPETQAKVDLWPPGKIRDELADFRAWATNAKDEDGKGRKLNWDQAWGKWLRRAHDDWRSKPRADSGNGLGRTASASVSVFGAPARPQYRSEAPEIRRIGAGAG